MNERTAPAKAQDLRDLVRLAPNDTHRIVVRIGNQPTAQFYRVNTDNLFEYRIYGGQQDNSTVAILSETYGGGISAKDFFPVGGGESAHIAFDPDNPRLIYATTINGTLTEYGERIVPAMREPALAKQ